MMDALEFLKDWKRMCIHQRGCEGCDLLEPYSDSCRIFMKEYDFTDDKIKERIIEVVKKWNREHPRKTRLQDFLEKYPRATLRELTEIPKPCAQQLGYFKDNDKCTGDCCACWHAPIDD